MIEPVSFLLLAVTLTSAKATPVSLGTSLVPLNSPWKFHTGDNPRWAGPNFEDAAWETVDLTPPPGAHDSDVGLTGYVPGWTARGHAGYSGYAWYRMHVSVSGLSGAQLAVAGPPDVDDAYQLFLNGSLLGSEGRFSGLVPAVYSIQPELFTVPPEAMNSAVLAFRVWMRAATLRDGPDVGGIHIAPVLGESSDVEARYRLQWLQTFCGYVVDAVEPLCFLVLAIISLSLGASKGSDPAYRWLSAALFLTAVLRANQALFFWTHYETVDKFDIAKNVVLIPLGLGAWTMSWRSWFGLRRPEWIPKATASLTLLYVGLQSFTRQTFIPHRLSAFLDTCSICIRLFFAMLLIIVAYHGVRRKEPDLWLTLGALLLISTGLFAPELSFLGIRGIWFPYGTGVSRTQFAYAGFTVVMLASLLRRLLRVFPHPRLPSMSER